MPMPECLTDFTDASKRFLNLVDFEIVFALQFLDRVINACFIGETIKEFIRYKTDDVFGSPARSLFHACFCVLLFIFSIFYLVFRGLATFWTAVGVGGIPPRPSRSEAPPPCSFRAEPSKKVFFSF